MNAKLHKIYEEAVIYAFDQRFVIHEFPKTLQETINEKFAELLIENVLDQVKIGFNFDDIKNFYKE